MAISRAQMLKELLPGLNALFGLEYEGYDSEHAEIYETENSDRSFEEEVKLSGFGQAPVKNEGAAMTYDSAQESFTARYNHETIALGFAITEEAMEDNLYDSLSSRYTKALARAMAPGTSLVLLDEPFCSLDVEVRSRLRSELSSVLKSCSASAVLVTHDPHEALAICDRVAVLKSGEIQQYSTPLEMVCNPSNDFVGQFVLQKNIIPIQYINGSYFTCIGELHFSSEKSISSKSVCMFDKNAIRLQRSENDNFRVVSKEYRISHFVFTVINEGFKLRAEMSLDTDLSIGDKCKVETIKEKSFLILPENIKSIF